MPKPQSGSLTAEAYHRIQAEIMACRLLPGQKLIIADLCAGFGFSLGAVREALSRLTAEGLVAAEPRKGFRVAAIAEAELEDITTVRATIEGLCLADAMAHGDLKWEAAIVATLFELNRLPLHDPADPDSLDPTWAETHKRFHEALVASCTSPWLLKLRGTLYQQSERYRRISVPLDLEKNRDLCGEHQALADAVIARDNPRALALMREHLAHTTRIIIASGVVKRHEGEAA